MKILNSIKAIFIILSLSFASIAFSAEPQMIMYTIKEENFRGPSTADIQELEEYEINNNDVVRLYAFKTEKKLKKNDQKNEKRIEKQLDKKLLQNMTVEVFAEVKVSRDPAVL